MARPELLKIPDKEYDKEDKAELRLVKKEQKEIKDTFDYSEIEEIRNKLYDFDENANKRETERALLKKHNEFVKEYADELIMADGGLSDEEKVCIKLGVILHDSGKLNSPLLDHGDASAQYAKDILENFKGEVIDGVQISRDIIDKVANSIERHMAHPYLIEENKKRKGKPYSEPNDIVSKMVFDADMLANIGFKNVGFRLNEAYLKIDAKESVKKGISVLEESFANVMAGVRSLKGVVLTNEAKQKVDQLVEHADKIFQRLKDNLVIAKVQNKFSKNGEFDFECVKDIEKLNELKAELNKEISNAGNDLGVPEKEIKRFLI